MNEFELIYRYFKQQESNTPSLVDNELPIIKGLGDDAAVIGLTKNVAKTAKFGANQPKRPKNGEELLHHNDVNAQDDTNSTDKLVTCVDTLVQGRHFSNDWQQVNDLAFAIGYKSVVVNVSDIAAMGAVPHSILLALALPKRLANEVWLSKFAKGLFHACKLYGVNLIGGDTTRHDKLVVSITANGFIPTWASPIYRSGAKIGDNVYVSGTLGDACYALRYPNTEVGRGLAHRLHMPSARVQLGQALSYQNKASSMIDVSDGLLQDLTHICQQSSVSMRINLESLPTSQLLGQIALDEKLQCQLAGGDDYELAFTMAADNHIENFKPPFNPYLVIETSHLNTFKDNNDDKDDGGDNVGYGKAFFKDATNQNNPQSNHEHAIAIKTTCIGKVVAPSVSHNSKTIEGCIELFYQGKPVTPATPYPFIRFPNLTGFQHFD